MAVLTRRELLACAALIVVRRSGPVRLVLRGAAGDSRGAAMALAEMQQTASLVGREIARAEHPDAMVVDIAAHAIVHHGTTFHVAASDDDRRRAIAAWRESHPDSAPHDALEWHPGLVRFGAEQLNARFERRFGARMTAGDWLGWAAVKIAADAQLRSVALGKGRYDGHKGAALYFDAAGRLVQPLCLVDARGTLLGTSDF
jgi:hypothetical protein